VIKFVSDLRQVCGFFLLFDITFFFFVIVILLAIIQGKENVYYNGCKDKLQAMS
jgi:hypothetical protein